MKRFPYLILAAVVLLSAAAVPAAAQYARLPQNVDASVNNNATNAYGFSPDAQIIVSNVHTATIEASEPNHTCSGSSDSNSVWFRLALQPGTITLDTAGSSYNQAGSPTPDTVISLYRSQYTFFAGFGELIPLACNDNGTSAGIISNFDIVSPGNYLVQVSAAQGVVAIAPSQVVLTATYTADVPHPNDTPAGAKNLKFPSLPAIINPVNATTELDEPIDPALAGPITNTVWYKFTLTTPRILGIATYGSSSFDLWYSLFQDSGGVMVPATTVLSSPFPNSLTAFVDPGTYYLRVGEVNEPTGASSQIWTVAFYAFMLPHNYSFAVGVTEGTAGATPSLDGWTMTNGGAGDGAFCDGSPSYPCYFQFTSSGATEATQVKAKLNLNNVKIKAGDLVLMQPSILDAIGDPDFTFKMKLSDAAGLSHSYTLPVTLFDPWALPILVTGTTGKITPTKLKLILKNRDLDSGDSVKIDNVIAAVIRLGDGSRDAGSLKVPLFNLTGTAWDTGGTGAKGVLPAPPPAD